MLDLVNHLRYSGSDTSLVTASGLHLFRAANNGEPAISRTEGTDPTHQIYARYPIGHTKGGWNRVVSAWYAKLPIPIADFVFANGRQTSGPISSFFTVKNYHENDVIVDMKLPEGIGVADTSATAPADAAFIVECDKHPHFDSNGNQVDPVDGVTIINTINDPISWAEAHLSYTTSPARQIQGYMLQAGISRKRTHWAKWRAWHDYNKANETVDYTTVAGFKGIGARGRYYFNPDFTTLHQERIDAVIEFYETTGVPAAGLDATNGFGVIWDAKLKPKVTGSYDLRMDATGAGAAELWIDGVQIMAPGVYTATHNFADTNFHDLQVRWSRNPEIVPDTPAGLVLYWEPPSEDEEVIPMENLYPLAVSQPRYETHPFWASETTLDTVMDDILRCCNSIVQDVDGFYEFYNIEQLEAAGAVGHFDETLPAESRQIIRHSDDDNLTSVSSLNTAAVDYRGNIPNVFEAEYRNVLTQFLEPPVTPLEIKVQSLIDAAGGVERRERINFFNMTPYQALKCLRHQVRLRTNTDAVAFDATARTYKFVAGDLVEFTNESGLYEAEMFRVTQAVSKSPQQTSRERKFVLTRWAELG